MENITPFHMLGVTIKKTSHFEKSVAKHFNF